MGETSEKQLLLDGLAKRPKHIPCSYLYDEEGSALYNQITELEEYYPYQTEISMLHSLAEEFVDQIPFDAVVVELGCGSATKTSILQRALLSRNGPKHCSFVGIDVSADFLAQAKQNMLKACPGLLAGKVEMIEASYMQGLAEARRRHPHKVLCLLWLGSSIGNLSQKESVDFFKEAINVCGPDTQMLVCTDLWKDKEVLHKAYCDSQGVTEAFIKNGLKNSLAVISDGKAQIKLDLWEYSVVVNPDDNQVEMWLIAGEDVDLGPGRSIARGERVLMEISRKFKPHQLPKLAYQAGLLCQARWYNDLYGIQLLSTPKVAFQQCQQATGVIFFQYVGDWMAIPISLRHPFAFYYGHVASFSKLRLCQDESPSPWDEMFARGIDPDVQNPSHCHSHPDIPEMWPSRDEVVEYARKVRSEVDTSLEKREQDLWLISMCLEHECMHQETLCYMLAQQQKDLWESTEGIGPKYNRNLIEGSVVVNGRPLSNWFKYQTFGRPGMTQEELKACLPKMPAERPGYAALYGCDSPATAPAASWVSVPAGKVSLGVDVSPATGFNWDNEGPRQATQQVKAFKLAEKPVTIAEFREFVLGGGYKNQKLWSEQQYACLASKQSAPATWTLTAEKDIWVHYPEGSCHWGDVKDRPVWCSLAEAQAFCKSKECRVMGELEYLRARDFDPHGKRLKSMESDGWEMTSSPMRALEGFQPSSVYPEYSADFYDEKHFVLRGSSPYTPAQVNRPEFRNFYQDVYPYHFAKFRCCKQT